MIKRIVFGFFFALLVICAGGLSVKAVDTYAYSYDDGIKEAQFYVMTESIKQSLPTVADASWLSKAWGRLENSLDTVSTDAPPSVDRKNNNIGHLLPKEDLKIAGVPLGQLFMILRLV